MNLETLDNEPRKLKRNNTSKSGTQKILSAGQMINSKNSKKEELKDVPSIRLSPEQIEEIHSDEYSLVLFYATRVEKLSLMELKRNFPEPQSGRAKAVLERFRSVGLVHITEDGKYYSNFPDNYINYSDYRYDCDLEAKKDTKVFNVMKEFNGIKEYWQDKTYFSIDGFFTEEQNVELLEMFKAIKLKAKNYCNENKSLKDGATKFRRMKFYHMPWMLAVIFCLSLLTNPMTAIAGGNDPSGKMFQDGKFGVGGGGNDPSRVLPTLGTGSGGKLAQTFLGGNELTAWKIQLVKTHGIINNGGGGHDPGGVPNRLKVFGCAVEIDGYKLIGNKIVLCQTTELIEAHSHCEYFNEEACPELSKAIETNLLQLNIEE
jgi:hypothetical protein